MIIRIGITPIGYCNMRIFLAGVRCVGKTTVGAKLADLLGYPFFDLDVEIERFFGTSIERLQNSYLTSHSFRIAASQALKHVLSRDDSRHCVIALPPSGLMGGYWKVVNKTQDAVIAVLKDTPENIFKRMTFYDVDSRPIQKNLTDREKRDYLRKIRGDITYFSGSFQQAHVSVDITGCGPDEAARRVKDRLTLASSKEPSQASETPVGSMH
jgi:shikimate kinase